MQYILTAGELKALQDDAERYRYLRKSTQFGGAKTHDLRWFLPRRFDNSELGKQLDEDIDRAIIRGA